MKYTNPAYPWFDTGRRWALRDNKMVPTAHAAAMLGLSKAELDTIIETLEIKPFTDNITAGAGVYAAYIMIEDFPAIMRHKGCKTEAIEAAMQQFEDVKNRVRGRRSNKKKKNDDDDDGGDDGDGDDEPSVVIAFPKKRLSPDESPSVSERSNNKNNNSSSSSINNISSSNDVSQQLKRMETMFETSLSMMGSEGLANYMKTDHWEQTKRRALEGAVKAELSIIREDIKSELRKHWEPLIKKDIREKMEGEDVDAQIAHNVLSKRRVISDFEMQDK